SQGPPPLPPLDPPRRLSAIHCPVGAVRCEPGPTASSSSRPTAASIRDSLPGGPAVVLRPASQGPPPLPPLDPPRRLSAIHCPVASQGPPPLPPLNPPRRLSAIHCSVGAVRLGGMQFGGGVCGSVVSGCVRSFFALESTLKWCIWTVLLRRIAGTVGAPSLKPVPFRNPPAPHQGCTRRLEAGCAYALPPIPHPPPCTSTSIPAALRPASALCLSFLCPSRLPPGLRLRTGSWMSVNASPLRSLSLLFLSFSPLLPSFLCTIGLTWCRSAPLPSTPMINPSPPSPHSLVTLASCLIALPCPALPCPAMHTPLRRPCPSIPFIPLLISTMQSHLHHPHPCPSIPTIPSIPIHALPFPPSPRIPPSTPTGRCSPGCSRAPPRHHRDRWHAAARHQQQQQRARWKRVIEAHLAQLVVGHGGTVQS
ncbi:unnamed protein product, partial [Closterium sp. NIES-54]